MILFTIIAILDHREKKQNKKHGELTHASVLTDSPTAGSVDGSEKRLPLGDEEDISPVRKEECFFMVGVLEKRSRERNTKLDVVYMIC